ncbi:hypothetical protein [Aquimarina sp. SS2-1]|uniref:hypothetical protein n=1 Tax=Aquimarina besae TaxID=3342247 RepID=UPI003670F576
MKKVFLGLFLAGTMMSFTNEPLDANLETNEDFGACCTATYNGFSATRCVESNNASYACSLARTYAIIASIQ